MFTSFNSAFKGKPLREQKVPEVMLSYLSNNLPTGVKYVSDEKGNLTITSSNGDAVTFGGLSVTVTDEMRSVLGDNCSTASVAQYAYNTQKTIEMNLEEDGIILINDEKIPIEKFAFNLFDNFSYIDSKFYMIPPKFPDPFILELGCEKYSRKLTVSRVPFPSLYESRFQSETEDPLKIEYIVNDETHSMKMTMGFDLKKAKTVRDIVETVFVYNAFFDGKGLLMGNPIGKISDRTDSKKFDRESALFWEKVLTIEEKLRVNFIPPNDDIDFSTMCIVEQLYQNIVNGVPTKDKDVITSITSGMKLSEGVNLDDIIGNEIFFKYNATVSFELFEVKFELPAILGIFNSTLKSYEIIGEETKINLGTKDDSVKAYTSVLCFIDADALNDFTEKHPDGYEKILVNAKLPQEYL